MHIYIGIPQTGYLIPVRDTPWGLARLGELLGRHRRRHGPRRHLNYVFVTIGAK